MNLPERFLTRMKKQLGKEFPDFLLSYEEPPRKAVRVNTLKISREEFRRVSPFALGEQVPWEDNGFYVTEEKTGGLYHEAGLYYSQEPSAMCAAPLLGVERGEKVLDLCAAPGGKTTQLAQAMRGEGLLIANEYVSARAKILLQNIERLGVKNCAVVSADSALLAKRLGGFFDKILVDAPCSGEGMFKKEENAVAEWSEDNVRRCAARQAEILDNAAVMLRAGGKMAYSTCTFSEEENAGQVKAFLARHPEFELLKTETLYPHRVRGEGHFAALFTRRTGESVRVKGFLVRRDRAAESAYRAFAKGFFTEPTAFDGEIATLADGRMYLLPAGLPELSGVKLLRAGIELGEWDAKTFKPAHSLAACMKRQDCKRYFALTQAESVRYLHGETLFRQAEDGWCVVGIGDFPLGLGKVVNGIVKNHYPKGLRR